MEGQQRTRLTLAAAVMFLNENELLPRMLASLDRQTRTPEFLLLVDDGSGDRSHAIAAEFAHTHPYAQLVSRPRTERAQTGWPAPRVDRLSGGAHPATGSARPRTKRFDLVAKLDADLELPADFSRASWLRWSPT